MKKQIIFLLSALSLLPSGIIFRGSLNAKADVSVSSELSDEYFVGDELSVPACLIDGKETTAVVTFPDRSVTNEKTVKLTMAGNYRLTYRNDSGTSVKKFTVYNRKYELTSQTGEISYREQTFRTGENTTDSAYGIYAELTEGSSFTYNKPIDISGYKKDDTIISLNVVSHTDDVCDFKDLVIRLTDTVNSKNYVEYIIDHNGNKNDVALDSIKYIRAGASNQTPSGIEHSTGELHVGSYGTWCRTTFMNHAVSGNNMTDTADIHMDYAERKCYGPSQEFDNYICDLDDSEQFGESLWDGFSTGECYVSVYAMNFFGTSGGIFIRSIGGESGDDFAHNVLDVTSGPQISIDYGGYDRTNLPKAVVGCPYELFGASAYDSYAACNGIVKKVYLNEFSDNPINVSVKNNTFTPNVPGLYTIDYIAENAFGIKSTERVAVECVDSSEPLAVSLSGGVSNGYTGSDIRLADYSAVNAQGKTEAEIEVIHDGVSEAIDKDAMTFRPEETGVYKAVYKIRDYAGQKAEASYEITIENSDLPIIGGGININKYLISGLENAVPSVQAIDYKDGKNVLATSIYVSENGGEKRKLDSNVFVPTITDDDYEAVITYEAVGKYGTSTQEIRRTVHNISYDGSRGKVNMAKLFVHDENVSFGYEKYISTLYGTYSSSADSSIEYVNPMPLNSFGLEFNILNGNAESVNIVLSDYYTGAEKTITFEKKSDTETYISIDGGIKMVIGDTAYGDPNQVLNIDYSKNAITVNANSAFAFDTSVFTSKVISLRIETSGVNGESKIMVRKVCNQLINDLVRDNAEPLISIDGDYNPVISLNETITVHKAVCMDMISPSKSATVSVYSPDGKIVEGIENAVISKEYQFTATEYGNYKISYNVDGSDNSNDFVLSVIDREAPEITITDTLKSEYAFGTEIKLSAKSVDALDGEVKTYICVEDTYGCSTLVENGSKFVLSQVGTYRIKFFAYDSAYNYSGIAVEIRVVR